MSEINNTLLTVQEAKTLIAAQRFERKQRITSLAEAVNAVLAEDIFALTDIPAFCQSSMDGFALRFADWEAGKPLHVVQEVPAGKTELLSIKPGEAVRIFTGAALPEGTDTVIMQELTEVKNGHVYIQEHAELTNGLNTRPKGAEIKRGQLALAKGTCLTPAAIGFLGAIGVPEVCVFARPSVGIVVTGDELQHPGCPLGYGQVYEASSTMLKAALWEMGIQAVNIYAVEDNLSLVKSVLEEALDKHDVVLTTGGVSVGDYDFVVPAALDAGVRPLFHKVKQRPGKPLFFGRKANIPFFGLPGNPSSVLTCFYEYVWPVIRSLSGMDTALISVNVPLKQRYIKTHALTHFLKGYYANGEVEILTGQESFRLASFAQANCLVQLPEEARIYVANEPVEVHLLPRYQ